jgi:hypothetical protein
LASFCAVCVGEVRIGIQFEKSWNPEGGEVVFEFEPVGSGRTEAVTDLTKSRIPVAPHKVLCYPDRGPSEIVFESKPPKGVRQFTNVLDTPESRC